MTRACSWCEKPMPASKRSDAKTCSQRCRQAAHRFRAEKRDRARAATPVFVRFADPPYPGLARRYYGDEPEFDGEVDHVELLSHLEEADGWALSTSADALPMLLSLLQLDDGYPGRPVDGRGRPVRVAVWVRGDRPGRSTRPRRGWEPVLYTGRTEPRSDWTADVLQHVARPRLTENRQLVGAKPAAFWWWLFELLGLRPGDRFEDLFPGTGAGPRAWSMFTAGAHPSPEDLEDMSCSPAADASPRWMRDASRSTSSDASGLAGVDGTRCGRPKTTHPAPSRRVGPRGTEPSRPPGGNGTTAVREDDRG